MLIETPFKVNDVITLKMIGGDEVVAKLTEVRPNGDYQLSKPLVVMMAQQGFGLAPFMLTANPDTKIDVKGSTVISVTKTFDAVAKQYVKQTTGLLV